MFCVFLESRLETGFVFGCRIVLEVSMRRASLFLFAVCIVCLSAGGAPAEEWGDLTARFVFDGGIPSESALKVTTDIEFCGKFSLVDERLTINAENKGIANVFAYLYLGRSDTPPEVHPSYEQSANDEVVLDNNKCRFDPHCAVLRTTQTLLILNSDEVGHNCKVDTIINPPINYTIPAGGKLKQQFEVSERMPSRVSCSIHPWMSGWLLIRDNPYMAISDTDGKLMIKNLPVGQWTIQFWQEKAGYVADVTQDGQPTQWRRGRVEVTIQPGENDLGEIKLDAFAFAD